MKPFLVTASLALVPVLALAAQPAADAPKRKAGLWEQKMTMAGPMAHTTSMAMCSDEKTDNVLAQRGPGSEKCESQSFRREGSSYVVEAVCKDGATTIRTRGVFTGDFSTSYRGEIRSTFDPPMRGAKEMTQTIEGRYVGPCKPGQKPGDVVMEGMGGMNVNEMMGADPAKMQEMMKKLQQANPSAVRPPQK